LTTGEASNASAWGCTSSTIQVVKAFANSQVTVAGGSNSTFLSLPTDLRRIGAAVPHSPFLNGGKGSKSSLTPESVSVHFALAAAISVSLQGAVGTSLGCKRFGGGAARLGLGSGSGGASVLACAGRGSNATKETSVSKPSFIPFSFNVGVIVAAEVIGDLSTDHVAP
jgi:hypothetical protein